MRPVLDQSGLPRCVLVEGVCGSGKTTIIEALAKEIRRVGVAPIVMPQKETYGRIAPLEDTGELDDPTNATVLEEIIAEARQILEDPSAVLLIDTLHLTQVVRPGVLNLSSFIAVDRAVANLGTKLLFLSVSASTIRQRTIEQRRGTGFEIYVSRFGTTDDALVDHFITEQRTMRTLWNGKSMLAGIELDADLPRTAVARSAFSYLLHDA